MKQSFAFTAAGIDLLDGPAEHSTIASQVDSVGRWHATFVVAPGPARWLIDPLPVAPTR